MTCLCATFWALPFTWALAGLERVYVDERPFEDKRAALEYAIARQRDRRNLSRKELAGFMMQAVEALDRVKQQGERADLVSADTKSAGKSAEVTAEKIGVSQATVERVRAVLATDDEVSVSSGGGGLGPLGLIAAGQHPELPQDVAGVQVRPDAGNLAVPHLHDGARGVLHPSARGRDAH